MRNTPATRWAPILAGREASVVLAGSCTDHIAVAKTTGQHIALAAGIPASATSVVVMPLDGSGLEVALNRDAPRNPASTMKLLTTYAALRTLHSTATHCEATTWAPTRCS
ncbi:MAG: hypothetical protein JSS24_04445 [Proteobacteria bacterium]|nr:hypothetical protein [Pseudomonadota bacterium]